ncbi:MarR family transcriptional regulator [Streptomyces morookaense]|uniref:MarR family winged helix-turn-helix transcriptional regulator n=1 Tax=Streptomyces morookaense TaxID=1970 RepID=UPI0033D23E9A
MGMSMDEGAAERLAHAIRRASVAVVACKRQALRDLDLTVPQYEALRLLCATDGMSAAQLARQCTVTPQTMATVISNLEQKAFVERRSSPLHQKVLVVSITHSGREASGYADKAVLAAVGKLLNCFSGEEAARFEGFLERAVSALEDPTV